MNLPAVALSALLSSSLFFFGGTKLVGAVWTIDNFTRLYRLPQWLRLVIGVIEVIGGVLLLVGIFLPMARLAAAALVGPAMLGAVATEVVRAKAPVRALAPAIFVLAVIALLVFA